MRSKTELMSASLNTREGELLSNNIKLVKVEALNRLEQLEEEMRRIRMDSTLWQMLGFC